MLFDQFLDLKKRGIEFENSCQSAEKSGVGCFEFPGDDFEIAEFFQAVHPGDGVGSVGFSKKKYLAFFHFRELVFGS